MPIRPSSSAEIRQLIEALGGADDVRREAAVARLAVIGPRAVEHLLQQYPAATARGRAGMLRALEASGDARVLPLARESLDDPGSSSECVGAAVAVRRAFRGSNQRGGARDALDALLTVALDHAKPAESGPAAVGALRDFPASVVEP